MPIPTLRYLTAGLLLAATLTAAAQPPQTGRPGPGGPARAEIRAYVAANVLPTLRQQRQRLEAQLAPADQLALAGYRAQLQALRSQAQPYHPHPATGQAPPPRTPEQREQSLAQFAQSQEIRAHVRELARKYQSNIEKLAADIQPQRERWTTDLAALATKAAPPEQPARLARWPGFAAHHGELAKLLKPSTFLLMETAAPADAAALGGPSLYPNPAGASSQLQYEVRQAGPVAVELLDAQGLPLRALLPTATREAGTYTQTLDFSELPRGTYFYRLTTAGGSETRRFVKE